MELKDTGKLLNDSKPDKYFEIETLLAGTKPYLYLASGASPNRGFAS